MDATPLTPGADNGWGLFDDEGNDLGSTGPGDATGSSSLASSTKSLMGKLGPVGDILQGSFDILGGIQKQQQSNTQATRFQQQAKLDLYNAGQEVQANDQRAQAAESAQSSAAGTAGVAATGSVSSALKATFNRVNAADVASRYAGQVQHNEDIYESKQMRYQGKQAFLGGLMSGVTSFVNAGTSIASMGTGMPGAS